MIISLCKNIFRRQWRRVVSIITAPIIVMLFSNILISDQLRLACSKPIYFKEISKLQVAGGSPLLKTWNWKEVGYFPSGCTFETLIYDDSDQINLAPQFRSTEWKQKAAEAHLDRRLIIDSERKTVFIEHLDGHFYLLREEY